MSPYLHPKLAILWFILTLALAALSWLLYQRRSLLILYIAPCLLQNVAQWYFVFNTHYWHQFYTCWWIVEFLEYGIALYLLLHHAFHCLRYRSKLPRSITWQAILIAIAVSSIYLFLRWYGAIPYDDHLRIADQACQLLLCGVAWIVTACCHWYSYPQHDRDILKGFVALYTLGIICASISGQEPAWLCGMTLQLGIILWWYWVSRCERS